jgi:hypothetical protein
MVGEMASRWCREAINVFLMDDGTVDQFWHLVWDLSAAGFGLPVLSELTKTVGFVWCCKAKGCFFGGNWRLSDIGLVSRLCSRRLLWFTRVVQSLHLSGTVNRWSLQSESTLEARPCTTGNTASR